jgi:hypothetical protein
MFLIDSRPYNICGKSSVSSFFDRVLLTSETRAETTYTQQLLRKTEMKIIRAIHGKTLRDKILSDRLQQLSGIQGIVKWVNVRRRELGVQVNRMEGQPSGKDRQR